MNPILSFEFRAAAASGNLCLIKQLPSLSAIDCAFKHAACNGHLDVVQYLLNSRADIHTEENFVFTLACSNGHLAIVQLLINAGFEIDIISIRESIVNGHSEVFQFLLQETRKTADEFFQEAALKGDVKVIKRMILLPNLDFNTAIQNAASHNHLPVVKKISQFHDTSWALRKAAANGHIEIVKFLVEKRGANIHIAKDEPFRNSALNGHLPVLSFLFHAGANIHASEDDALRKASSKGHLHIVKFLLDQIKVRHFKFHQEALQNAAAKGHLDIVQCLVHAKANLRNDSLQWACEKGHLPVVQFLLKSKSNVHKDNDAALKWARFNGHQSVVECLLLASTTNSK